MIKHQLFFIRKFLQFDFDGIDLSDEGLHPLEIPLGFCAEDGFENSVDHDYLDYYGSEVLLTSGIENLNTIDMKD